MTKAGINYIQEVLEIWLKHQELVYGKINKYNNIYPEILIYLIPE